MPSSGVERRGPAAAGFTMLELLVSLLLTGVVLTTAVSLFTTQNKAYIEQDVASSLEQNLRFGMGAVTDTLRAGGYGVPTANLSTWVTWVSGFTANPLIAGSAPQKLSIASCFQDVATLSTRAALGATTLSLTSSVTGKALTDLLNTTNQKLILIDGSQSALVTAVNATSVSIDTDPLTTGAQGLTQSIGAGASVCRVDVKTFAITTDTTTGIPWLGIDLNQGQGSQTMVQGISNLALTSVSSKQYQVTLTARAEQIDPATKAYITRSLSSNVTLKNRNGNLWVLR